MVSWCSDTAQAHKLIAPVRLHAGFLQLTSCVLLQQLYDLVCRQ